MGTLAPRLQTGSPGLARLCRQPVVAGWVALLLCLGPPTLVMLLPTAVDTLAGYHHLLDESHEPTPLYVALIGALAVPWNLWLGARKDVRVSLLFMPGWAFGVFLAGVAAVAWLLDL